MSKKSEAFEVEKRKEHGVAKRIIIIVSSVLALLICLVIINFIPTFHLKTSSMKKLEGDWVDVYYETEEAAAKDVFALAETEGESLTEKLGFTEKQDVRIFIYDEQSTMQRKKYGFIGPMLHLDWYIGDNIKTDVILTSPANPGKVHTYDEVKDAVCHEMVHAYVSVINEDVALWLTEGMALYLANGEPFDASILQRLDVPTYKDTLTSNPMTFEKVNGYMYAHIYIEFLDKTYGWDKVLEYIKTEDADKVFQKSQKELYNEWIDFMDNYEE